MTKPTKMACAPSEDSDQPGFPPILIRVFAVRMEKVWVFSFPLSVDAQADLSLRWAHIHCVGFVMWWLIYVTKESGKPLFSISVQRSNFSFHGSSSINVIVFWSAFSFI